MRKRERERLNALFSLLMYSSIPLSRFQADTLFFPAMRLTTLKEEKKRRKKEVEFSCFSFSLFECVFEGRRERERGESTTVL